MNLPSILIGLVILAVLIAVAARGIYNRKHHRGGCSCGCTQCPGRELCHSDQASGGSSQNC